MGAANNPDEQSMRALSIRQPYAELILRGEKTIEYRSRPTRIIGERFYIYASRKWAGMDALDDCSTPMQPDQLPTGVIVGSAIIRDCTKGEQYYEWHLTDVERCEDLRKPTRQPQPVWFVPFKHAA